MSKVFYGMAELEIRIKVSYPVSAELDFAGAHRGNAEQTILDDVNEGNFNCFDFDARRYLKSVIEGPSDEGTFDVDLEVKSIDIGGDEEVESSEE